MCHSTLFFLMIRRPPRSTLFPTRRSSDLHRSQRHLNRAGKPATTGSAGKTGSRLSGNFSRAHARRGGRTLATKRSEEHTSELQSPYDLVCRLLLEKKKKKHKQHREKSRN